jgi:dihydroorotate dehydrogenase (fumarate)
MASLKTKYLGIELKNPIIVGASNMVTNPDILKALEDAGAAAIVYKSLFEEQIQLENLELDSQMSGYDDRNAEMINLFPSMKHAGPEEHLLHLRKAKESVHVPVIASLNAIYKESWIEYARLIQETGVDAIELNFYFVPMDFEKEGKNIIREQIDILIEVKKNLSIPVSIKLSPYYTNTLKVISEMDKAGADGFVLFNKMFEPEIDIDAQDHFSPFNLSSENDHRLPLRYAGLLSGKINSSICSSTGIYSGKDVVKMILAGADAVQIVSTLYKNKISHLKTMLEEIGVWMKEKEYESLDEFRGKLSSKNTTNPYTYKRAQYIDLLLRSGDLIKGFSLR